VPGVYEAPGASVIGQLPFSSSDLARLEPEKQDRNQLIRSLSAGWIYPLTSRPLESNQRRASCPLTTWRRMQPAYRSLSSQP